MSKGPVINYGEWGHEMGKPGGAGSEFILCLPLCVSQKVMGMGPFFGLPLNKTSEFTQYG